MSNIPKERKDRMKDTSNVMTARKCVSSMLFVYPSYIKKHHLDLMHLNKDINVAMMFIRIEGKTLPTLPFFSLRTNQRLLHPLDFDFFLRKYPSNTEQSKNKLSFSWFSKRSFNKTRP
jgi:hypothetical protein